MDTLPNRCVVSYTGPYSKGGHFVVLSRSAYGKLAAMYRRSTPAGDPGLPKLFHTPKVLLTKKSSNQEDEEKEADDEDDEDGDGAEADEAGLHAACLLCHPETRLFTPVHCK